MNDNGVIAPRHPRGKGRSRAYMVVATAVMVASTTLTAASAQAAPAFDPAAVEQTLRSAGAVYDASADQQKLASPDAAVADGTAAAGVSAVSVKNGLTIGTGAEQVQVRPVGNKGDKAMSPSGLAVFANGSDSAFAFSTAATGGNAGYAVIQNANAPTAYRFQVSVGNKPAVLQLDATGGILNSAGTVVNSIAPAWALDANGAQVPTSYSVTGNIVTQTVQHAGAAYPVVADPRVRCDGLWCTLELTRHETALMADNALNAQILCTPLGPGVVPCTAVVAGGWAQANIARATGQCVGVRVWQANFVSYPHLAYIRCYA
jgi:type II secretory pathway pseudopilin PulG